MHETAGVSRGQKEELPRLMRTGCAMLLFLFANKFLFALSELDLGLALMVTT